VFNPQTATPFPDDQRKGLEVVTTIGSGKVTINLRNRIDKITQKLGSVDLHQDDDVEIQLFDWCSSALDQKATLETEKSELRRKYETAQATITSLDAKLEELVKAKIDNEEQLISKFVLLLNEKKLKIRNQQRILSTAKVDPKKLQQMQNTLEGKGRQAKSSRPGKRRATAQTEEDDADDAQNESSDAFEQMDLDKQQAIAPASPAASSSDRHTTPDTASESGTATEGDSDDEAAPPAPAPAPASSKPSHRPSSTRTTKSSAKNPTPPPRQTQGKTESPPPPVRSLPFTRKSAQPKKAAAPAPAKSQPSAPPRAATGKGQAGGGEEAGSDDDDDDDDEL
jgi:DNA polymerase III alpha subunit (gram-positive type)